MNRRAYGSLEQEVLRSLWEIDRPASPADVIDHMGTDLAYSSVATILGRLCAKGQVTRERVGRAFLYTAVSETDLTARRLRSVLDAARDRDSALVGFAESLDADEARRLIELLERGR